MSFSSILIWTFENFAIVRRISRWNRMVNDENSHTESRRSNRLIDARYPNENRNSPNQLGAYRQLLDSSTIEVAKYVFLVVLHGS